MRSPSKSDREYCIGYLRVSTEEQARKGISLDAQKAQITAWAKANGYQLGGIFSDNGVSGARMDNRPGLQEALGKLAKGNVLVVYSLSRLGRSVKEVLELAERFQKSGIDLISLSEKIDTTSAHGKAFFQMTAVWGEFERNLLGERVRAALHHKKAQGEAPSGIARYGYRAVEHPTRLNKRGLPLLVLKPVARELEIVKAVRKLRARGLSFQGIADKLTEQGFKPRGKRWHAQTVSNILAQQ